MIIDLKKLSLPFKEDEIEWRIQSCGKKGNGQIWATCLAYVQARAIMNRLDDVCGPENWKVEYWFPSQNGVVAKLFIKIGEEWVAKEDGAEQTDIEAFKGGLSSALKRAGSVWGIGRYLYGLETGYANITADSRGAKWGKTKDGAEFYWLPPKLPQWALPEGQKADTNGIHPAQPGPNDGIQDDRQWKFTFGQWRDKTVEQVYNDPKFGGEALISYCNYLETNAEKTGKPLTAAAEDAIKQIELFLGAMENVSLDNKF